MKTNAIIRIIIFSITIVILLGILLVGISYGFLAANLYSGQGDLNVEIVGPVASDENVTMGSVNPENIRELEIEWASGSITILPGEETDSIRFWDDYSGDEKYHMYYTISGNKLKIQFCEDRTIDFGIHFGTPLRKNLTVTVPSNWVCDSLEVETASSKLEVHDLTIGEVDVDNASGALGFENCNVDSLDIDTASGDVIFSGTLNTLDCDGASATIVAHLNNIPTRMDVDTASGNLDIILPENAGFTVNLEGLSTDFSSDFETITKNGSHISGDGACRISVSAMSGDVTIRKNPNLTSVDITVPDETQP